ncbi:MAG: DUF5985 family protein [Burkholderiaceae bacterium]
MNALEASTTFTVNELLLGGIALACVVAGLFFWRFWRTSRDRFFLLFAISFWVEAANRIHMGLTASWNEALPSHYLVRLLCYGLILFAIWDKNRPGRD